MAVFAYARVSTNDQTVESQRLEVEAAGYTIDYFFRDTLSGETSASQTRYREAGRSY